MALRREISIGRAVVIYVLGAATGVQGALYLYDTWDDGISDPLSGIVAAAFLVVSVITIISTFRGGR